MCNIPEPKLKKNKSRDEGLNEAIEALGDPVGVANQEIKADN